MKLQGVYVANLTPFRADGTLDVDGLRDHVRFLLDSGVHGLVPCGTTGESPTITREERRQIISLCLKEAAPRGVSVIAGCGSNNTATAIELVREAEELGVQGTLIVTPYYNRPTPEGVIAHYAAIADSARTQVVLYHVPGRTAVHLPLESVRTLFKHPRITAIKEASGQHAYWQGLCQIAKETGKTVLSGDDDAYAVVQAYGGQGIISATANAVPAEYVKLHQHMVAGEWAQAFALQLKLAPLVHAFFAETSPGPLKYALSQLRGSQNVLRLPLVPITEKTQSLVRQEWNRFFGEGAFK